MTENRTEPRTEPLPTYFLSHGGGPWPWVPEMRAAASQLEASLVAIPRQLGRQPSAFLVVSAHWEAPEFRVMAHPKPPMVYDYSGFAPNTYEVQYPAPGAPALAARVCALIQAAGLPAALDADRGFDHGSFVPLAMMAPKADIPAFQLSLQHRLDPAQHLALGRALAPLRQEGVLILGSGLSYHNLRRLGPAGREPSQAFDDWLHTTLLQCDPAQRVRRLLNWQAAPAARVAHPREDHLIPLLVALGAAEQEPASCIYREEGVFGGITASSFSFGKPA